MDQSLQMVSCQERLALWAERIRECRSGGTSVRNWCRENGVSEKTYYYWQKRLYDTLSHQQEDTTPGFAEVTPTQYSRISNVSVTVRISGAKADIHSGADAATIETVLRILKSC